MKMKTVVMALAAVFAGAVCGGETAFLLKDVAVVYEKSLDDKVKIVEPVGPWIIRDFGKKTLEDFIEDLKALTGGAVMKYDEKNADVAEENAEVVIYLGDTAEAKKAGIDTSKMRLADFRLKTTKDKVFIAAKGTTGVSYGITEFLHVCDCWHVTRNGDLPVLPKLPVAVPAVDVTKSPAVYYRWLYSEYRGPTPTGWWETFTRRLRGAVDEYAIDRFDRLSYACGKDCHTFYCFVPPEKYFQDHPEYYSLNNQGKRQCKPYAQLCLTNPDVKRIVYESLVSFIEKDRKARGDEAPLLYDFSQEDNFSYFCTCPECKKVIAKYNRVPGGHREGGDTGLLFEFVNDLARKVAKDHPGVRIRTFAYNQTDEPPAGDFKVEDNVVVWWADVYSQSIQTIPLAHPNNARQLAKLQAWHRVAKHIELWDYYGGGGATTPADAIAADAKTFRENGVTRLFWEGEMGARGPLYDLDFFLTSEFMFDPDQDLEKLIAIWCRGVYGKAAEKARKAIDFGRSVYRERPPKAVGEDPFKTQDVEKYFALVKEAYDVADTPNAKSRLAHLLSTISKWLLGIKGKDWNASEADLKPIFDNWTKYGAEGCVYVRYHRMPDHDKKGREGSIKWWKSLKYEQSAPFTDLPEELKKVPPKFVECLRGKMYPENDAISPKEPLGVEGARVAAWKWGLKQAKRASYEGGFYDREAKKGIDWKIEVPEANYDGQYHWYRFGPVHLSRSCFAWFLGWSISLDCGGFYRNCDGADIDPNNVELWFSIKFQGPAYQKGSTETNGILFDRAILHRIPIAGEAKR